MPLLCHRQLMNIINDVRAMVKKQQNAPTFVRVALRSLHNKSRHKVERSPGFESINCWYFTSDLKSS